MGNEILDGFILYCEASSIYHRDYAVDFRPNISKPWADQAARIQLWQLLMPTLLNSHLPAVQSLLCARQAVPSIVFGQIYGM